MAWLAGVIVVDRGKDAVIQWSSWKLGA